MEILGGVGTFFLQFFKRFVIDLYHALYYRAVEYDSELQQTKTFTQRFAIWAVIITVATGIILLLLNLLYRFISSIDVVQGI